jgi:hypothetical protein
MMQVNVFQEYNDTVLSVGLSHLPGNQGETIVVSLAANSSIS